MLVINSPKRRVVEMAASNSQKLAQEKYNKENYDRLAILIKKGKRDEYHAAAAAIGLGYAEMIRAAIEEFIQRHAGEEWTANQLTAAGVSSVSAGASTVEKPGETLSREEKKLLEEFRQMPVNSQKHVRGLIRAIIGAQVESD